MSLEIEIRGQTAVYSIDGALDAECVAHARELAMDVIATSSGPQVFDGSGVTFMDSSGLGFLVSMFKQSRSCGRPFALAGLRGQPLETLKYLKIDRVVPNFADLEAAMAAVLRED